MNKKIYNTPEEKRLARNLAAKKYYESHKEIVKAKCKAARALKKAIKKDDVKIAQAAAPVQGDAAAPAAGEAKADV